MHDTNLFKNSSYTVHVIEGGLTFSEIFLKASATSGMIALISENIQVSQEAMTFCEILYIIIIMWLTSTGFYALLMIPYACKVTDNNTPDLLIIRAKQVLIYNYYSSEALLMRIIISCAWCHAHTHLHQYTAAMPLILIWKLR